MVAVSSYHVKGAQTIIRYLGKSMIHWIVTILVSRSTKILFDPFLDFKLPIEAKASILLFRGCVRVPLTRIYGICR
jgi:hypothetical protein